MNAKDYYELFRYLMEQYCLLQEDILFVENIADWCKKEGIPEPDRERPFKLALKTPSGCRMLIRETIPERIIDERINAMRIRNQIKSIAFDIGDLLNSDKKKLAYLFLSEYATSLPGISSDEIFVDEWALKEMERLGFFKEYTLF